MLGLLTRIPLFLYLNEMTRSSPALFEKKKDTQCLLGTLSVIISQFVQLKGYMLEH